MLGETVVDAALAGEGTPGIAEYAVETLAATLGLSYAAGLRLVSEAVELCYRLPRLWDLVQDGRLQAWKARRVAAETTTLSAEAVGFVDRHLAVTARRNSTASPGKLRELVHEAMLRCDPDRAAGIEQAALDARGVWFDHRTSTATTDVTARLDTLDALDLQASVATWPASWVGSVTTARSMSGRPPHSACSPTPNAPSTSPTATAPARRRGAPATPGSAAAATGAPARRSSRPGLNGSTGTLYLHVTTADLAADTGGTGEGGEARTRHPPAAGRLDRPVLDCTIRPVLDLARDDAVDVHDPPAGCGKP